MFKWPEAPSPCSPEHELADFAELVCWERGNASVTALTQLLGRLDENDYSSGVPEEDEIPKNIQNAFIEIERRTEACGAAYPFALNIHGDTLCEPRSTNGRSGAIYRFLLLVTRLNMGSGPTSDRTHAGIDATRLFEEISAEVSKEYFGQRAESMVFGTHSITSAFSQRVDELCERLGEGDGFQTHIAGQVSARDGKLDVVAWKPFSDRLAGKLIGFGQCKTGTSYKDTLTQLHPDSFCKKWMRSSPAMNPIRMFFVAEALPRNRWYEFVSDAGLLFDRNRIVDFSSQISQLSSGMIEEWTIAAANANGLPQTQ